MHERSLVEESRTVESLRAELLAMEQRVTDHLDRRLSAMVKHVVVVNTPMLAAAVAVALPVIVL